MLLPAKSRNWAFLMPTLAEPKKLLVGVKVAV